MSIYFLPRHCRLGSRLCGISVVFCAVLPQLPRRGEGTSFVRTSLSFALGAKNLERWAVAVNLGRELVPGKY